MATDDPRARIFMRPMGSPLPLGLAGLAIASLLTSGVDLGWVALAQSRQIGFLLLIAVVPIQLLACAFAFPSRDGATASTVGILAATWAAYGLGKLLTAPGLTSHPLGLLLLMAGGLLLGGAISQSLGKPLPGLVMGLAAVRFALSGVYELTGGGGWQNAAGAVGLVVCAGALYLVWALELEDARDRPLLPTFRRGGQRRSVEDEAGVRAQL